MDWIESLRDSLADRYVLGPEIGAGGMGVVFRAEDVKHGRSVAIKVLRPEWTVTLGGRRFLREIEIASSLVHPGIVPLFDSGQVDGALYYVMPLVDGESLRSALGRQGAVPPLRAIELVMEIADALDHAHQHGVTHRDIKPSNIIMSGRHALLVDFGIAQAFDLATDAPATEGRGPVGTPAYMSPEQLFGEKVTPRSDLYSLGCVFFELLTGHRPVQAGTGAALAGAHLRGEADFARVESEIPEGLRPILRRLLATDPADRFESATELREALEALTDGGTAEVTWRVEGGEGRRRSRLVRVAGLGALALAVVAVVPFLVGSDEARAARAYASGVEHLEASRLAEAERDLRRAVELDPDNAMAKYRLALALYWRVSTGELPRSGSSEIPPLALAAVQESAGLPEEDSLHILGFYRFQQGDYAAARGVYEGLIEQDPTDAYAWLLLGIIEFDDPWLAADASGDFRPAASLNRSLDAFSTATGLRPGFHLGYGHISDIADRVVESVRDRSGRGFHYPQNELVAPWEDPTPDRMAGFIPAPLDSIVWMTLDEYGTVDTVTARSGATRLLDRSVALLKRWIAFAPDLPRPREETADLLMVRRQGFSRLESRAEAEEIARTALAQADTALSLRTDTTSTELFRMARLSLAADRPDDADVWLGRGLEAWEEEGGTGLSRGLVNIPLARGDLTGALGLLSATGTRRMYFPDQGFDDGGADEILKRLRALAEGGGSDAELAESFDRLDALWSPPAYSPSQIRRLREQAVPRVALGLWRSPQDREAWAEVLDTPTWRVVAMGPEAEADAILEAHRVDTSLDLAVRSFILASLAQRNGHDEVAVQLFSRLDDLVRDVGGRDSIWALEPLSWGLRSVSYRRLGDIESAERFASRFAEARPDAPISLAPGAEPPQ